MGADEDAIHPGEGVIKGENAMQRLAFKEARFIDALMTQRIQVDWPLTEDNVPKLIGLTLLNFANSILSSLAPQTSYIFFNGVDWRHC